MSPEVTLRWGTTLAALIALAGFSWTLGVSVSPALAFGAVLALSGAGAVVLWRRRLDRLQMERDRARLAPEQFTSPDVGKY